MIGIISTDQCFSESMSRLLQAISKTKARRLKPELTQVKDQLNPSSLVFIDANLDFDSLLQRGGLAFARALRDDEELHFHGAIIVLAFAPINHVKKWTGGEMLDTPGCFFHQLPITSCEIKKLLESAKPLTKDEWHQIFIRLQCEDLAKTASRIRHDYDGVFSQPKAHLLELQKLSYFNNPDVKRVAQEIQYIRSQLTEEKLNSFLKDLEILCTKRAKLNRLKETHSFEEVKIKLEQLKRSLHLLNSNLKLTRLQEIFRAAGEVQSILESLLNFVTTAKEEAIRGNENE